MAESAGMRSSSARVSLTSEASGLPKEFRNRPGRDLLIALAIGYLAAAMPLLVAVPAPETLLSAALACAMIPLGVMVAIMRADLISVVGLGLLVALVVAFAVRLPGVVRIPLLLVIFGAAYWCAMQAGTLVG